jgi:hypothetical protein
MHIHSMLAFALIALNPLAVASAEPQDLVATFSNLENTFARAYQQKDFPALKALLAPEYTLTVSARPGNPVTRPQWLALLPNYNVRSFAIHDVQVRCLHMSEGKCDLAAVSSVNKQQADVGGQDRSGEFFIVDIWANHKSHWVVLSRYSGRTETVLPMLMNKH